MRILITFLFTLLNLLQGAFAETTSFLNLRQEQANAYAKAWTNDHLFEQKVLVHIREAQTDRPRSDNYAEFSSNTCHVYMNVETEHGTPILPGMPPLDPHENDMAFAMILFHELSHCAHFAKPLRFERKDWSTQMNEIVSVQMVMAHQHFNEFRYTSAQMEHVADAHAAMKLRQKFGDTKTTQQFLNKFLGLRQYWFGVAQSIAGPKAHMQHATMDALRFGMIYSDLDTDSSTLLNVAIDTGSKTSWDQSLQETAWGGIGALVCATTKSPEKWASIASDALARIEANDVEFLEPGPWKSIPLDRKNARGEYLKNEQVFLKSGMAQQAWTDLNTLRAFITKDQQVFLKSGMAQQAWTDLNTLRAFITKDQLIPLDDDTIGVPQEYVPMDNLTGMSKTTATKLPTRRADGCVAYNAEL